MVTFDLSNGYHHVPMTEELQSYLGFSWNFDTPYGQETKYIVFLVQVFVISSACYTFTKVMRPFLKKWRGEGIRSSLYLDDGLLACKTYDIACRVALKARSDLEPAGFHINYKKSCWTPSQQSIFGFPCRQKNDGIYYATRKN